MKAKAVLRTVALIGIITLSATAVHAGQGQGGTSELALECRNIGNTVNQHQHVVFNGTEILLLNSATLLCKLGHLSKGDLSPFARYSPSGDWECFQATAMGSQGPPETASLQGPFGTESVLVDGTRYICLGVHD